MIALNALPSLLKFSTAARAPNGCAKCSPALMPRSQTS